MSLLGGIIYHLSNKYVSIVKFKGFSQVLDTKTKLSK